MALGEDRSRRSSILATYLSEVADGFDLAGVPPSPPDRQRATAGEAQGKECEGAVPEEAGRQDQGADLTVSEDRQGRGRGSLSEGGVSPGNEVSPLAHQLPALRQEIRPGIGLLDGRAD